MRVSTRTMGTLGIAAAAFAAGRLGLLAGTPTIAGPVAPVQDDGLQERWHAMADAGEPGPHHARLDTLVGSWDATFSAYAEPGADPVEVTGSIERTWILGGRFIMETVKGTVAGGGVFEGIGILGYNNIDGRYEVAWVENASTGIVFETAWFDPADEVLHFYCTRRDALDHTVVHSWSALNISSRQEHRFAAWQVGADGVRFKNAEGTARRRVD